MKIIVNHGKSMKIMLFLHYMITLNRIWSSARSLNIWSSARSLNIWSSARSLNLIKCHYWIHRNAGGLLHQFFHCMVSSTPGRSALHPKSTEMWSLCISNTTALTFLGASELTEIKFLGASKVTTGATSLYAHPSPPKWHCWVHPETQTWHAWGPPPKSCSYKSALCSI